MVTGVKRHTNGLIRVKRRVKHQEKPAINARSNGKKVRMQRKTQSQTSDKGTANRAKQQENGSNDTKDKQSMRRQRRNTSQRARKQSQISRKTRTNQKQTKRSNTKQNSQSMWVNVKKTHNQCIHKAWQGKSKCTKQNQTSRKTQSTNQREPKRRNASEKQWGGVKEHPNGVKRQGKLARNAQTASQRTPNQSKDRKSKPSACRQEPWHRRGRCCCPKG